MVAPEEGGGSASTPVSMEDLKSLELSLSSSLATELQVAQAAQNKQMQEMMNTFMASLNKLVTSSSPPPAVAPTLREQRRRTR